MSGYGQSMGSGWMESGGNLVDILKEDMTSSFGDKLRKRDERRVNSLIFKVRVFHNDL
jgi:hypothetical protein